MHLGYFFLFMGAMMSLLIGMMSWLIGSINAIQSTRTTTVTLMAGVTLAFSGMFALFSLLPGPDSASLLWTAAAGLVAGCVPMPFILRYGRNLAANRMAYTQATAAFALSAYDQLVEPGTDYITEDSLRRLLRTAATSDETRQGVSALLSEFRNIGTKIGEEKGYFISVETKTTRTEYTADYRAITRESLQAWPKAVHEKRRSWLA